MDSRLLTDLYDIAEYYSKQLQLLDFQSYNGLSNTHKKVHTIATKESMVLKNVMHILLSHSDFVTTKSNKADNSQIKQIDIILNQSLDLPNHESELLDKYQIRLSLDHSHDIKVKFALTYKNQPKTDEEAEVLHEDHPNEALDPLGLEVIYTIENIRALVAPYYFDHEEELQRSYPLIAPSITNIVDDKIMKGRGAQDSHLYIPDLHTRILELEAKLEHIFQRSN